MEIREAVPSDIPQIVQVLKLSLGESDLPLSEEIWHFKHMENPFGPSVVLIAEENGKIIGVRALMRWTLFSRDGQKKFNTYRAVDTATHPEFQGRGVFSKLTLKAVEKVKEKGDSFIFNFPNNFSRPGYLKMGWKQLGKINIGIKPALVSFWKIKSGIKPEISDHNATPEEIEELCKKWNSSVKDEGLFTPKSFEYLNWRYHKNPLKKYSVFSNPRIYLSACIDKRKGIKELRITECIFLNANQDLKKVKKIIRKWSSYFGVQVITFSPKLLHLSHPVLIGSFGPILTIRELNLPLEDKSKVFQHDKWNYSLGDMELF